MRRLRDAGIGFTIVSSRPTVGMRFLIEPLAITLPVGSFNGSSIVDPQLNPIEQHLIPAATAQTSLDVLERIRRRYLAVHQRALAHPQRRRRICPERNARDPGRSDHRRGFRALSDDRLQDRRRQPRRGAAAALRSRDASRPWARRPPPSGRKAIISTSPRRATTRAPSSQAMARRLGISDRCGRHHRRHAERSPDVRQERPVVRDGQRGRRHQATRDACHGLERGRGICEGDGFVLAINKVG